MTERTALGGTLIGAAGQWRWSDGTPEPRVVDMSASWLYNFRCQGGCVEVLLSVAHRDRDTLGWVLARVESGMYQQAGSGDHTGPRIMHLTERYEAGDVPGVSEPGIGVEITRQSVTPAGEPTKRAIPQVALVPVAEWDMWSAANPVGAKWEKADEPEIFAKARSLGWAG